MAEEVTLKRRRVTQACESCRSLKSKCDGKRPVCSRCRGYGYDCRWRDRHVHSASAERLARNSPNEHEEIDSLRQVVQASRSLLFDLRKKVDDTDQRKIDIVLGTSNSSNIQSQVASPTGVSRCLDLLEPLRRSSISVQRYLGEISDVSFFNSVKGLLQNDTHTKHRCGVPLESYEREAEEPPESSFDLPVDTSKFLDRNAADKYVAIYFSTIHIAYPYIDRRRFLDDYEKYWDPKQQSSLPALSVALLFAIFAIGSYYDVCTMPTEQSARPHYAYFQRASVSASCVESDYEVDNVRVLLAQCFYLLLAQWTDRCWLTLGLAIRIAQSIGLHIERGQLESSLGIIPMELQRRTWHSLYVLDRLLSIQLGRPSAIRNHDCTVRLPSCLDDEEFDAAADTIPPSRDDEPTTGDYFIAVIKLSAILRHVERDVYRPTTMDYTDEMLQRTDRLDAELLRWKSQLPRWLRFDRGHTFERSAILKRQRNMLAIKYHHLRALIHRPYLCLPWIQRNDNNIKLLLDSYAHRVVFFERTCVQEAQATAHLLHDVTDKKSLVEDFPWWQMISCLICASSILLVMRAFMPSANAADQVQREILEEDANTCLKVFDALSLNSAGARRARDMLQNLRDIKVPELRPLDGDVPGPAMEQTSTHVEPHWHEEPAPQRTPMGSEDSLLCAAEHNVSETLDERFPLNPAPAWTRQVWPSEIADSMAWSSQFVDAWDPLELQTDQS